MMAKMKIPEQDLNRMLHSTNPGNYDLGLKAMMCIARLPLLGKNGKHFIL